MPFARRRRVDLCLWAAVARHLIFVGGGARFSAARRRRRGVLRRPDSNFTLSVQYIFTICLLLII
jgi:hypothetical protein